MSLRVERRIAQRLNPPKKETWIKVGFVKQLTGWDKETMRRARENKLIVQKKENNEIFYLLESIPERFLKQSA